MLFRGKKNILFIEYNDIRVIKAITMALTNNITYISLLGNKDKIYQTMKSFDTNTADFLIHKVDIIDPKSKKVKSLLNKDLNYSYLDIGNILLKNDLVDGMIAGSIIHSKLVIKSALKYVGLKENINTLSSYFLMKPKYINKKSLLFADCAVVKSPNTNQLVDITLSTATSYKNLFGKSPKIALLSHSTKGSSTGDEVTKITDAISIINDKYNDLCVDGELQLDAALVPEVAKIKAPYSPVAGQADVLIFPNLDAGNIAYKLTERLGNYTATGPVLQGLRKPSNDLSRGCSVDDIYNMITIT